MVGSPCRSCGATLAMSLVVVLGALVPATGAPCLAEMSLSVADKGVVATGVTPGALIEFRAVLREWNGAASSVRVERAQVADEDLDGQVLFDGVLPVPVQSIWFVVDPVLGLSKPATGKGNELLKVELGTAAVIGLDFEGAPCLAVNGFADLEILAYVPGRGVFEGAASDGGLRDADGEFDGVLQISLDTLESSRPEHEPLIPLPAGTRITGISPRSLTYFQLDWHAGLPDGGSR